jgi:hypothetical protein
MQTKRGAQVQSPEVRTRIGKRAARFAFLAMVKYGRKRWGQRAAHSRWHLKRQRFCDRCPFCMEEE